MTHRETAERLQAKTEIAQSKSNLMQLLGTATALFGFYILVMIITIVKMQ